MHNSDAVSREIHCTTKYYIDRYITLKKDGAFIWVCYNDWVVSLITHGMSRQDRHKMFHHIASILEAVEHFGGTLIPKETL